MRILLIAFLYLLLLPIILSQPSDPPAVVNNFSKVTSYEELSSYLRILDAQSDLLEVETIGQSVEGRNLYALKFSSSEFGTDTSKIRVMIFAQQHGNEQSGKEGALLLASALLKPENRYLFDKIDLLVVPQVNPDGSEVNKRRNANDIDLNRNHLILTEPETQAIHRVFDRYLFEVTMDVHEYSPYGEEWKNFGARKNSEITLGTLTNPNVSGKILDLSRNSYLPFIFRYLNERGYSAFEYLPGGPPGTHYLRRSTFDINDGRQSLGILNTFSFIQEGMNGKDNYIENLQRRAESQCAGMRGLLEFVYMNMTVIKKLVSGERLALSTDDSYSEIAIQCEHINTGKPLELPLMSYFSGQDTLVVVNDFRSEVRALHSVPRPVGYLVPKAQMELVEWIVRYDLLYGTLRPSKKFIIEEYFITGIDSVDFEGDTVVDPRIQKRIVTKKVKTSDYFFISTNQLKGNLAVIALEPRSMLGLITYKQFGHLLMAGQAYPVLRVVSKL